MTMLRTNRTLLITLALMGLALFMRALPGARTIDDAFITFRYSRNLLDGLGFVYNPGVFTLGTTTPLWTLLMAALGGLLRGGDFPHYAILLSALADAGTCALLYVLARRLTGQPALAVLPGLLWALSPMSVTFAVGGMETSANIFWMVAATAVYVHIPAPGTRLARWRLPLLGVLCGMGILTRIDSLLWVAPLLLAQTLEALRGSAPFVRRLPLRTWVAFGLVLLPWFAFAALTFGSPFPRSLNAKTVAYSMPPASALVSFIQAYATPFFEYETFGGAAIAVGALLYLGLSAIGLLAVARRLPRLLPFLLYPFLYLIVFAAANPLIFRWYLAPPMPALMLGIFAGLWVVAGGTRQNGLPRAGLFGMAAVGLVWMLTSLGGWTLHPDHAPDRPAPLMAWHKIELLYEAIGTELRESYGVTPQTVVASGDIGAVGYFSRATILDTVGLVTPAMSAYYPISPDLIPPGQNYAIPPRLILDNQPAYLVAMESMVRLGLEQDADFRAQYELLRDIPTDFYGTGMRLYRRR